MPKEKKPNIVFAFADDWGRYARYGNTGCGVFKRGVQNYKDFCLRINI